MGDKVHEGLSLSGLKMVRAFKIREADHGDPLEGLFVGMDCRKAVIGIAVT